MAPMKLGIQDLDELKAYLDEGASDNGSVGVNRGLLRYLVRYHELVVDLVECVKRDEEMPVIDEMIGHVGGCEVKKILYRLEVEQDQALRYVYGTEECGFAFHTLAEVGAPYQQWFKDEIKRRGWKVRYGVDLDAPPYTADFLIGEEA